MELVDRSMPVFEAGVVRIDISTKTHPDVWAVIDEQDWARVKGYRWSATKRKKALYVRNHIVGLLHRFILNASDELIVDHKDGDTLNNRRGNLRECTYHVNNQSAADRKRGYGIIKEKVTVPTRHHIVKKTLANGSVKEYTYPSRSKKGTRSEITCKPCDPR